MFWVSSHVETARFDAIVVVESMVFDGMMPGLTRMRVTKKATSKPTRMLGIFAYKFVWPSSGFFCHLLAILFSASV